MAAESAGTQDEDDVSAAVAFLDTTECWARHFRFPERARTMQNDQQVLGTCNLAYYSLVSLPDALAAIAPRIVVFDVSSNHLRELPGALLARCTTLRELDCRNNELTTLPAEIGACAALQVLHCDNNQLRDLPAELAACTALQQLSCTDNPFDDGARTTLKTIMDAQS